MKLIIGLIATSTILLADNFIDISEIVKSEKKQKIDLTKENRLEQKIDSAIECIKDLDLGIFVDAKNGVILGGASPSLSKSCLKGVAKENMNLKKIPTQAPKKAVNKIDCQASKKL